MKNIKLTIQYDGTRYNGWQKQNQKGNTAITIQGKIEDILSKIIKEDISLIGCGRTDSGVHAENYIANFLTNSEMLTDDIKENLNKHLPDDIAIKEVKIAKDRFHSRYNVKSKTYVYRIDNNGYVNVFTKRFSYHVNEKLDIDEMRKASEYLIGTHDFRSFTSLKSSSDKSTIRKINDITIKEENGLINVEINGNGFLLNMVRIIVANLLAVGKNIINAEKVKEILEDKNKESSFNKAPAKGLTLKELFY